MEVLTNIVPGMGIFNLAPGGFFVFGCLIAAAVNYFTKGKGLKKKEFGCDGCAMSAMGGARKEKRLSERS